MSGSGAGAAEFARHLESLVASHRRFQKEFGKSLKKAGHFVAIADRALEQEPDSTVELLQQIREIDLLGHLQRLADEFDGLRVAIAQSPYWGESERFLGDLQALSDGYEALQAEAAEQLNRIDTLLQALLV